MPILRFVLPVCILIVLTLSTLRVAAQETESLLLSGSGSDDTVAWEFKVSGGRRAGEWTTIPVPSNWEMQGFGTYRYWSDWEDTPAPDHTGWYRHRFVVPESWRGRSVDIVFGAAMTDTEVRINGQSAGPTHQGGFYEFRHTITPLLRFGESNLLEVTVHKFSSDRSVNLAERRADYWMFGGIFRPVWLEARPAQHVDRLAIDARHDGAISIRAHLAGLVSDSRLVAHVETLEGQPVGEPFSVRTAAGQEEASMATTIPGVHPWSAEWPHRYRVVVSIQSTSGVVHQVEETVGFRSVELRPGDGFYVNGRRIRLKGVNRHTIWPTSGRTTNRQLSVQDVQLIRGMNMNAVRMSHYPPDRHFLEVADELGLYVIDELAGWQDAYATEPGRILVQEMIRRDVNHPSVVIWANGNEGGNNHALLPIYAQEDPQRRLVIHPWNTFNGINTSHYERYDVGAGSFFHGRDVFMPTEFLHGLYDGGSGAGLEDWWDMMLRRPLSAGGFLWALVDEGIVREDQGGRIDVAGNAAPDGIVGPFREKEGSYFTIKRVWSPVALDEAEWARLPASFDGRMRVHNRYDFTDLDHVRFRWQLVDYPGPETGAVGHSVAAEGVVCGPPTSPGLTNWLDLPLPVSWLEHDGLHLTALDARGEEIYTWTWMIRTPHELAARTVAARMASSRVTTTVTAAVDDARITLAAADLQVVIDRATGELAGVRCGGKAYSLSGGPRLVSGDARLTELRHAAEGDDPVITARYDGTLQQVTWRLMPAGWLRLDYAYRFPPDADQTCLGVTFNYPEQRVTSMRWLGRGPYRVWKNRLKGVEFDVWEKAYNDTVTGHSWEYPEFKGYHANVHWARLDTTEGPITLVLDAEDLFLRVLTPTPPGDAGPARAPFPAGDLSFLHGIPAIGSKFHPPAALGPSGEMNRIPRHGNTYEATVFFRFGD